MAARTPVFSGWSAIRSRGPVCDRWRSFPYFYADVGKRPSWRHLVIRDDPSGAFEPGNAGWQIFAKVSTAATDRSDTLSIFAAVAPLQTPRSCASPSPPVGWSGGPGDARAESRLEP
jgi:hypothetical protein